MVNMFDWLFKNKQDTKSETIITKITLPCVCESGNSEQCDLILQLRKYQDIESKLNKEIEMLDKDSDELIFNFIGLLKSLERNGLIMGGYYSVNNYLDCSLSRHTIKETINKYSSADIFRITEELRTHKNKEDIMVEKIKCLKEIQNKIKEIKDKLGIK